MNNVCWLAEATEKSRAYCIYTDLYALVVMPWVCLLRILGLPMSDSVWNCGRSLVLWVPGISGSIGNGILGEYFPEREYTLLNPKRTRKRPKFQPCPPLLVNNFTAQNSTVLEWFFSACYSVRKVVHDPNSRDKFSRHRQNKILKCFHKQFSFCDLRNKSCNTYQYLTINTVRTACRPSKSLIAEHCLCLHEHLCWCFSD